MSLPSRLYPVTPSLLGTLPSAQSLGRRTGSGCRAFELSFHLCLSVSLKEEIHTPVPIRGILPVLDIDQKPKRTHLVSPPLMPPTRTHPRTPRWGSSREASSGSLWLVGFGPWSPLWSSSIWRHPVSAKEEQLGATGPPAAGETSCLEPKRKQNPNQTENQTINEN